MDAVEERLGHEPAVETRNRKPIRPNPLAPWELRIGNLRVYYDVEVQPGMMLDFNDKGYVVGVEILNLSDRVGPEQLRVLQFET